MWVGHDAWPPIVGNAQEEHSMSRSSIRSCLVCLAITCVALVALTSRVRAGSPRVDVGAYFQQLLGAYSEQLFGFRQPLQESAPGPYDGPDNLKAIQVAPGLKVS